MDIPRNISRKIVLTGVVTLGVFALGSAGAAAVAQTLTIGDRTGAVQRITSVTTGTTTPSPSAAPFDDRPDAPEATTTVEPADPVYVNAQGDVKGTGTDDGIAHAVGDDTGGPDDTGKSGDTSGSGGSTSGSGGSRDGGSDGTDGNR
jgi:uncharacterized membrane protein YgcG